MVKLTKIPHLETKKVTKLEQEAKEIDPAVQAALEELLGRLNRSDIIQSYKKIESRVSDHEGLHALTEEIKAA